MRQELREQKEQWRKDERNLQDWEHLFNLRERRIDVNDDYMSQLMKDLRIKEDKIDSQSNEIRQLQHDIDEGVCRAREEYDREWKVCVLCR